MRIFLNWIYMNNIYKSVKFTLIFFITLFILSNGDLKAGDYVTDLVGWYIKCLSALPIATVVYFIFKI